MPRRGRTRSRAQRDVQHPRHVRDAPRRARVPGTSCQLRVLARRARYRRTGPAPEAVDHAVAVECINYFPDPARFLSTLRHRVLPRSGRVAFCAVTSERPQTAWERLVVGLVSHAPSRPGAWFVDLARRAGFASVRREDITKDSLLPAIAQARRRIEEDPDRTLRHGWAVDQVVRRLIDQAEESVASGWMRYEVFTAA